MIRYIVLGFLLTVGSFTAVQGQTTESASAKIANAQWERQAVSPEIVWKHHQFDDLFDSKQSITVFEIDLSKGTIELALPHVESGFVTTSEFAEQTDAIVAINGSFFNTKTGGSTVFLKQDGKVYSRTGEKFTSYRENAGFAVNKKGDISIIERPEEGWKSLVSYPTLLASGPLLINQEEIVSQKDQKFNTNRHPRTAIGITKDNRLIAVVVDGRNANAHGASIQELSIIMEALGCTDAMNLDGGGSSAAWVKGQGIVNYPSDNKKWDHLGERAVANALCFKLIK
ncbi:phosphodiester glycosidase family protein [Galbibacter sp.]|jgi:exopolysaccharide biosynthesis protein|uniref:phosphodiester glycosidase family protein n=1 Tax=Galbibacter sp. TaxID=2918471 RepID=UPI003A904064